MQCGFVLQMSCTPCLVRKTYAVWVCVTDFIYAVSGKNQYQLLDSVEQFDVHNRWNYVQPLETAVYDHAGDEYEHQVAALYILAAEEYPLILIIIIIIIIIALISYYGTVTVHGRTH